MKAKPLNSNVLVLPKEAGQQTAGGLIIMPSAESKTMLGTVVAVGPGTDKMPMEVKEGDTVLFGRYIGVEVVVENTTYLMLNQENILAIIEV